LPGQVGDYLAYRRWFDAAYATIELPPDCAEIDGGPTFSISNQFTWTVEWYLVCANAPESYIRVAEHFAKVARLLLSQRKTFAYHFGPVVGRDRDGTPLREPADPVFVRIDNSHQPAHLHPERDATEHLPQANIKGLILDDIDLFDFVRACIRSRQAGRPVAEELGYAII